MKPLSECKERYMELYMDYLTDEGEVNSDSMIDKRARFYGYSEALSFIYGDEFEEVYSTWRRDAGNYYYSNCVEDD